MSWVWGSHLARFGTRSFCEKPEVLLVRPKTSRELLTSPPATPLSPGQPCLEATDTAFGISGQSRCGRSNIRFPGRFRLIGVCPWPSGRSVSLSFAPNRSVSALWAECARVGSFAPNRSVSETPTVRCVCLPVCGSFGASGRCVLGWGSCAPNSLTPVCFRNPNCAVFVCILSVGTAGRGYSSEKVNSFIDRSGRVSHRCVEGTWAREYVSGGILGQRQSSPPCVTRPSGRGVAMSDPALQAGGALVSFLVPLGVVCWGGELGWQRQ